MKPQEYVWKFLQENADRFPDGYPQQLKIALEEFAEWYAAQQSVQPDGAESWRCSFCGNHNPVILEKCVGCGSPRR